MDDLKLFAKSEDQLESLINTVRILSDDIHNNGIWIIKVCYFDYEKRKDAKNRRNHGNTVKSLEEGTAYKYLNILEENEEDQTKADVNRLYMKK